MAHRVPISADDSQEEMRRMLLAIIPRERGKSMRWSTAWVFVVFPLVGCSCPQSSLSRRSSMAV